MAIALPSIPTLTAAQTDSLTIEWNWNQGIIPGNTQVMYRKVGKERWLLTKQDGATRGIIINGLPSGMSWQFRVRGLGSDGERGTWSEIGGPFNTLRPCPNTSVSPPVDKFSKPQRKLKREGIQETGFKVSPQPMCLNIGFDCVTLQNSGLLHRQTSGILMVRQINAPTFMKFEISNVFEPFTITNLQPDTHYEFFFRDKTPSGLDNDSQSCTIKTRFSAKLFAHTNSTEVRKANVDTPVRKLVAHNIYSCRESMTRILQFGSQCGLGARREKTLMLVGATGAGKSTLLDGMVNYLLGVERDDNDRYTIIDVAENEKNKTVSQSQTEWITMYKIYATDSERTDAVINIIDTPGFGDTRGIERDKKLVEQIKQFFSHRDEFGVHTLDAVCFVAKASETRLTVTHRYICSSVLAVFGKNIAENILATLTFYDGSAADTLILALKQSEVPFDKCFYFNNSALFANPKENNPLTKNFWNIGMESFDNFFTAIDEMAPRSLVQTAEVLEERSNLEIVTNGLVYKMHVHLLKVYNLEQEQKALKEEQTELQYNKLYTYTIKELKAKQVPLKKGKRATNCTICNMTCHKRCTIKKADNIYKCDSMKSKTKDKKDRRCLVCSNSCLWSNHTSLDYEIVFEEVSVTKTDEAIKMKYTQLCSDVHTRKDLVVQLQDEITILLKEVTNLVKEMKRCKERLSEIALKPNPMTEVEFIDFLMMQEEKEGSEGYLDRITGLKKVKEQTLAFENTDKLMKEFHISK